MEKESERPDFIVEKKGFSAITVGTGNPISFGHAAIKNFNFELTSELCKPAQDYTCQIHIYNNPAKRGIEKVSLGFSISSFNYLECLEFILAYSGKYMIQVFENYPV